MRRIKRTLALHGKEGAIALVERGRARRRASAAATPAFDLWDEPPAPDPSAGKELLRPPSRSAGSNGSAATASPDPDFDPPPRPAARLSGKQLRARRRMEISARSILLSIINNSGGVRDAKEAVLREVSSKY